MYIFENSKRNLVAQMFLFCLRKSVKTSQQFCFLQGVAYVLARWFKWHLLPKLFMLVKFYDLFVLIWFLRVFFVIKLFHLDLHSLRKLTSSAKILDVKKAIACNLYPKQTILDLHSLCFNFCLILKLWYEMEVILHLFCPNTLSVLSTHIVWNCPCFIANLIEECQTELEFLQF